MTEADLPMTRSDAISQVVGWLVQIEGEWGSGGDVSDEAAEVLTALGVTRDELIAHNIVKEGYFYEKFLEVAQGLAVGDTKAVARKIAENLDYRDERQRGWRTAIFERFAL